MNKMRNIAIWVLILCTGLLGNKAWSATDYGQVSQQVRSLLSTFIAADTSNPPGNESKIVTLAAHRLAAGNIPYEITDFEPGRQNLVARLKGNGTKRPLLILAHIDVVTASGQQWESNPHQLTQKGAYLIGRGVEDDLGYAAVGVELLLEIKRSGVPLDRDIILALTGDEERGGKGIQYLLSHHRDQIDAEIALNEGGAVILAPDSNSKPLMVQLQVAEKIYQDFKLTAQGPTGHSSLPQRDNAIYKLSAALSKIDENPETAHLIPVTRSYFKNRAKVEKPPIAQAMRSVADAKEELPQSALVALDENPITSALLRTTCVATQISGGTAPNALPAEVTANVNCRLLPDESVDSLQARLTDIIQDPKIQIFRVPHPGDAKASPLTGPVYDAVEVLAKDFLGGIPVIPMMGTGATDSRFLRAIGIQAYGISPIFLTESDRERMHGIDERISTEALPEGIEFFHRLILKLAASS